MAILRVRLSGGENGALLQHNVQMADPLSEIAKQMKPISSKRTKTEKDHIDMRNLEMRGGLYWKDGIGVYVPPDWIEGSMIEGAKKNKQGKALKASAIVVEAWLPLDYEGKSKVKTVDDIVNNPDFCFTKSVKVSTSRVMRSRPIFRNWSLEATIEYDDSAINRNVIVEALEAGGRFTGIGDFRPRFGKFNVEVLDA